MKTKIISKAMLFLAIVALFAGCKKSSDNPAPNTGNFAASSTTYSGPCTSVPDVGSGGALGNIDVEIVTTSGASFIIYNMPQQSSGTYTLTDGYDNVESSQLYAIAVLPNFSSVTLATKSGTVTKTGSKSFTFSCTVYDINSGQTVNVTGKGSY